MGGGKIDDLGDRIQVLRPRGIGLRWRLGFFSNGVGSFARAVLGWPQGPRLRLPWISAFSEMTVSGPQMTIGPTTPDRGAVGPYPALVRFPSRREQPSAGWRLRYRLHSASRCGSQ
jgi:hypothetical protein